VFDEVDHEIVAGDEAAERGEALGERPHDQIHVVRHTEVGGGAVALRPQHARSVRIVHHQPRAVLAEHRQHLGQGCDIALHREDAVNHHERTAVAVGVARCAVQRRPEPIDAVVVEALHLGVAELAAVIDAGVVVLVDHHGVVPPRDRRDRADVGAKAGGEHERPLLAHEPRQPLLELLMDVEVAVEQARSRARRAVRRERLGGPLAHVWVRGEAEVVVGAEHHQFLAVDEDAGVRLRFDHLEVRVVA
jgi:hypothetical protein